ncbi:anti-sigma factor antagonist [Halobacillus litoralis]|uniref:Anti-sigma factor antagonist n=3 Tax=Halobacillus TaxID=45667 RepID=A0A845E7K6_9BACI|nr:MULTISPECIES: STAS domain-containing protein [Halobacillus]MBN9656194.1 STAS domain-containing protein [Halobacillus sp. GSS1]MEC3882460.1 STAS domain-containing protein [Halobacillus sp. HZG1]MYL51240.1 anti-sigma factor antagonist [Halobacillus litoralis]MYL73042.1 anti-sigma factor antagonist [Halobacillus litoralis]RDY70504.1 anti-sigma factor antagonist [Halobacillus trueperi]
MNLSIDVTNNEGVSNVVLTGEVDAFTAPKLKDTLLPLTKEKGQVVEVDFQDVNYMDSTGLGVFISALKSTKEHESEMRLVHMQDRVYRLFKITGLTEIINIESTVQGGM